MKFIAFFTSFLDSFSTMGIAFFFSLDFSLFAELSLDFSLLRRLLRLGESFALFSFLLLL
jgi:hypothetical protein